MEEEVGGGEASSVLVSSSPSFDPSGASYETIRNIY